MTLSVPQVVLQGPRVVRLVPSARDRAPILAALTDDGDIDALAEIEGATSRRLLAQEGSGGRYVRGVAGESFINAAFAYPRPGCNNRFNARDWGAWYAADRTATALMEVAYHITRELKWIDNADRSAEVHWAELFAYLAGDYADLRPVPDHPSLNPDPAEGYPAGVILAREVLASKLNGIVYPSVRMPGGVCYAVLHPHAVQSVAQGELVTMRWNASGDLVD